MKIGLAQINPVVGDFARNSKSILDAYQSLVDQGADLVVTPELALCGYPPQDLVFKSGFVPACLRALDEISSKIGDCALVVGFVSPNQTGVGSPFHNSAAVLCNGAIRGLHHKIRLPTYDVFDEARYFAPGGEPLVCEVGGLKVGITICEDIWEEKLLDRRYPRDPVSELCKQGCRLVVNLSASPFSVGKPRLREAMLRSIVENHGVDLVYCNAVGGNDQLLFDGHSLVVQTSGRVSRLPGFASATAAIDLSSTAENCDASSPEQCDEEEIYSALVMGTRDYAAKCGFRSAVLGLSGGIDSALTACIAVDALGAANVHGVAMPSRHSSQGSLDDAAALAANLGISYRVQPIEQAFDKVHSLLAPAWEGGAEDATEENLQSRLRGLFLMAFSNKFGHLLLTTGNKSELAVGYCTLYGDMCGGLAVISDLPKTIVYTISRWRSRNGIVIPTSTIDKPPSAELRPDQKDQDTLPPYEVLDAILQLTVEEQCSAEDILAANIAPEETVRWVLKKIAQNEYKRQQAAPGLRVTSKAFGFGRRMPIAQNFADG